MRVIAGEFRSRKLLSVESDATRPTSDRLRETLFDILQDRVPGCVFLDAYAGTGAVGIEALSRGARLAVFIEKDRKAVEVIRKNLESLKIEGRSNVIRGSAHQYLGETDADIVFLDPPYPKEHEYQTALRVLAAKPTEALASVIVVQHPARMTLAVDYGALHHRRTVKQGDNALSFYLTNS